MNRVVIEVPESNLIIVSDYESVVARLLRLVELIDTKPAEMVTELVPVVRANPTTLCGQVKAILSARASAGEAEFDRVSVTSGVIPDKLILIVPPQRLTEVKPGRLANCPATACPTWSRVSKSFPAS